jgi:pyrimidine deaminase RibD-like protein
VSSRLSHVPVAGRRRFAATLCLFAALFLAIGVVAATGGSSAAAPAFSVLAFVVAALLALMGWGVVRTIAIDRAEHDVDAAIETALAPRGGRASLCDCGHEHDPTELHLTDPEPCSHDGTGAACEHDCESCVLAGLRHDQLKR